MSKESDMFDIDFPLMKDVIMKSWVTKKYHRREKIHVSSLLHCRRKVCYERLDPKSHILDLNSRVNQRSVRYYLVGEAQHRYLSDILGTDDYEYEKDITYTCKTGLNIVGHCDNVDKRDGTIIEIKTAHTAKVLKEAYPSSHLDPKILTRSCSFCLGLSLHMPLREVRSWLTVLKKQWNSSKHHTS